jgi:hypothetical protein
VDLECFSQSNDDWRTTIIPARTMRITIIRGIGRRGEVGETGSAGGTLSVSLAVGNGGSARGTGFTSVAVGGRGSSCVSRGFSLCCLIRAAIRGSILRAIAGFLLKIQVTDGLRRLWALLGEAWFLLRQVAT